MAVDSNVAFVNTNAAAFPGNKSVNATGPAATDGTEFVKVMIDNYMFGPQQALLNFAGLIPDGIPEEDGTSQELEAMQKSFGYPGEAVNWYGDLDPAVVGARILLLHGQGILIASYPELTTSVYVGDGNNATAPAFYKADDAAGTIRNTAGIYLILPDGQDVYPLFMGESLFSARISSAGAILSESKSFINSISKVSTGRYLITFNVGLFTAIPSVVASAARTDTAASTRYAHVAGASTASVYVNLVDSPTTANDYDFTIHVQRQGSDYNPFGDAFIEPGIRY